MIGSSSISDPNLRSLYETLVSSLGSAGLHAMFPNDFEYYMVGLELTTYEGKTIDFLLFPVLPSQIRKSEKPITNIKKTLGGVVSLISNKFIPIEYNISGNFGRSFKIVLQNEKVLDFRALGYSFSSGKQERDYSEEKDSRGNNFSMMFRSGYGLTKMLQGICNKSLGNIYGQPNLLFFYNLALGDSYLVEYLDLTINQGLETNKIWNYNLNLKAVAPMSELKFEKERSLTNLIAMSEIQKSANNLANTALGFL